MKISIITVCYNAEKEISKTMESVLGQTWEDMEYLIVDGASTDGTLEEVKRCSWDDRIRIISEPDNGIYDAMNKGIANATGDYINFMNAGDSFCESNVLEKIVERIEAGHADIYYGDSLFHMPGNIMYCSSPSNREGVLRAAFRREMINHQSMFVRTDILKKRGFSASYRIAADLEWLLCALDKHYIFEHVDLPICNYDQTGLSSQAASFSMLKKELEEVLSSYAHMETEIKRDYHKENELYYFDLARRNQFIMNQMNLWLLLLQKGKNPAMYFKKRNYENVVVYGMGMLGRRLIDDLKGAGISVVCGMDRNAVYYTGEFPVYACLPEGETVDVICVTAGAFYQEIKKELEQKVSCDIVSLEEVIAKVYEEE